MYIRLTFDVDDKLLFDFYQFFYVNALNAIEEGTEKEEKRSRKMLINIEKVLMEKFEYPFDFFDSLKSNLNDHTGEAIGDN